MSKKRRVSRTQRQKISRGLKRYWRAVKTARAVRVKAARKGWVTRRTAKTFKQLQKKKKIVPAQVVPESREREEWEVTVSYSDAAGTVIDLTFRLIGKPGARYTNDQVRAAMWYAHKYGAHKLTDFTLDGLDWRNTYPRGKQMDYSYPDEKTGIQEVLDNAGGILNTVGLAGLRVALVEQ